MIAHNQSATAGVVRSVLPNGLTVLIKELHACPVVTSMIWYRVGSRNEEVGQTGKSHFLEHMLFKGSDRFAKGQIDQLTLKHGGSNNAFTSHDFTGYYFSFASDRWEIALDIESDRMMNCSFDASEFEAEKRVIIEELKSGLDSPWGRLMQTLDAQAFQIHPYRNPVVGWLQDVENATVSDQQAYYRRHYSPDNAILVMVGDLSATDAMAKAEAHFGSLKSVRRAEERIPIEPPQEGERRFQIRWRSRVPRLIIGYRAPQIGHPDSYALHLASLILSEGKSSRLYRRMVEKDQLVTFVSTEMGETQDPLLFHVRAEARGETTHEQMESVIYEELEELCKTGPSPAELHRAKHQIQAHFLMSQERTMDQAILLGQVEIMKGLSYLDDYVPQIQAVTADDIARIASAYLREESRTVGWLVYDGSLPDTEDSDADDE